MEMERVLQSAATSMQTVPAVGIAVYHHGGHIGLLYRGAQRDGARILHLGGHLDLRCESPSEKYTCWIRPAINIDRAKAIAAFCRRIWKKNSDGQVPYGFSKPGQFFDFSGNQIRIRGPAKVGLTCATFVLEVFDKAGFPLVKYDSWPSPSQKDVETQQLQLRLIQDRHPEEIAHTASVEAEIGNIRYAPLQIAGAGTADTFPADHMYASAMAAAIEAFLKAVGAPTP
jgi:hypothetical protein